MLIDVLTRFCADTGINPVAQRSRAIQLMQDAARELYAKLECNAIYREMTLVVPGNKIVALDNRVGEIKGMREHTSDILVPLDAIGQPRYTNNTWQYRVRNWRQLADSPIHTSLTSVSPLTIESNVVESTPVTITINGQTDNASRESEEVVLDAASEVTTKNFGLDIFSIVCRETRTGDITIKDSDGIEIAILRNIENATRYRLVDVSEMFWNQDTEDGETLVDVLYKVPQTLLTDDSDIFYAGDSYDDAWYYMSMFKHFSTKQDRAEDAKKFLQLALGSCRSDKDSSEESVMKKVNFGRNKFFDLQGPRQPVTNSPWWDGGCIPRP